jgi:hypothetical protein
VKGDSFAPDKPRLWSEKKLADFGLVGIGNYDLAPDGKRIAAIMPAESAEAQPARAACLTLTRSPKRSAGLNKPHPSAWH